MRQDPNSSIAPKPKTWGTPFTEGFSPVFKQGCSGSSSSLPSPPPPQLLQRNPRSKMTCYPQAQPTASAQGKGLYRTQLSGEIEHNSHTDAASTGISRRKNLFTSFEA